MDAPQDLLEDVDVLRGLPHDHVTAVRVLRIRPPLVAVRGDADRSGVGQDQRVHLAPVEIAKRLLALALSSRLHLERGDLVGVVHAHGPRHPGNLLDGIPSLVEAMPYPIDRGSGSHDGQRLDLSLRRQVLRLHVGREPIHRNGHPICRLLSALFRDGFRQLELAFLVHGSEFAAHRLTGFGLGVVVPGPVQVPLENVAPSEVVDRVANLDLVRRNVVGQEGAHGVFQGDDGSLPALQGFDRGIRHPIRLERQGQDLHAVVDGRRERRSRDELICGGLPGFQNTLGHELRLQLILKPFGEGVVRFDDRTETGGHGIVKADVFFRWHGPGKLPCPIFPGLPVHHRPVVHSLERTLAPVELAVLGHARSDDRLEGEPATFHGVRQFLRAHAQVTDGRLGVEAHVPRTLRPGRREVPSSVELRH